MNKDFEEPLALAKRDLEKKEAVRRSKPASRPTVNKQKLKRKKWLFAGLIGLVAVLVIVIGVDFQIVRSQFLIVHKQIGEEDGPSPGIGLAVHRGGFVADGQDLRQFGVFFLVRTGTKGQKGKNQIFFHNKLSFD